MCLQQKKEVLSSMINSAVKFQWETRLLIKMKNTAYIKEYMKKRRADAEFRRKREGKSQTKKTTILKNKRGKEKRC